MLAYAVDVRSASRLKAADVKISEAKYTPVSDYPIQPKTYSDSFPKYRMDPGKLETLKMMLVACSDDLSRQLGNQKATPTEDVA